MRSNTLVWLWCMWRARRAYSSDGALFSRRIRFMKELRPFLSTNPEARIDYPDAIFWVAPADIVRARAALRSTEAKR